MSAIAQITQTSDGFTDFSHANIYISITDGNGNPQQGNGVAVTYAYTDSSGTTTNNTVNVYDSSLLIYYGDITSQSWTLVSTGTVPDDTTTSAPATCDALVVSVGQTSESRTGAADGSLTVYATSSAPPVQYSINNVKWQTSNTFNGLTGGIYTVYIKDYNGCTNQKTVQLLVAGSLLVTDPGVTATSGNTCRWNAAFNPVVFTYQRQDFFVTGITAYAVGNGAVLEDAPQHTVLYPAIQVNGDMSAVQKGESIYIEAGPYKGVYTVKLAGNYSNELIFDAPYVKTANNTGFVNINSQRPYYSVQTLVSYTDPITGSASSITLTNRPNPQGVVKADLSSFLQSLLRINDDSDYTQPSYVDNNLFISYTVAYGEAWGGHTPGFYKLDHTYYATYAARQLGQYGGGNLCSFVPFKTAPGNFITDFTMPAYSDGYPFDLTFIYSEDLADVNIYGVVTQLDINGNELQSTGFLLTEAGTYLLNEQGGRFIIEPPNTAIQQTTGISRMLVKGPMLDHAYYLQAAIYYQNSSFEQVNVINPLKLRVDKAIDLNSVYLRWMGLTGCWNYYRFVYDQEVDLVVDNAVMIKKYVNNWQQQQSIEKVISKTATLQMKLYAEDLSVADIKGLQSIKYSPEVQMLTAKDPVSWQTVIVATGTFTEYNTQYGQAPFSITISLPGINTQYQ